MKFTRLFGWGALILVLLTISGCGSSPQVSITFGGDIILARDGQPLFDQVDPWVQIRKSLDTQRGSEDGLFFANLESPLQETPGNFPTTSRGSYPLCAPTGQIDVLRQGGINAVNLANNHQNDCTGGGRTATGEKLAEAGIAVVGKDDSASYFDTAAGKIAVIGVDDVLQPLDENQLLESIHKARSTGDFLIVAIHWGNEYQNGPDERQYRLAQLMADNGVDVLWGTHPHVLQPVEWVTSSDGAHQMLAMYSLGNLLSDQGMLPSAQLTAVITLQIQAGKIIGITVLPLQMDPRQRQLILPDAS